MIAAFLPFDATGDFSAAGYRPVPAIHGRAYVQGSPFPSFGEVGTGGLGSENFYQMRQGYHPFVIVDMPMQAAPYAPFARLMADVKAGFGRTMTRLPEVFGVSRQTLYNWLEGETPKPVHHARLEQLAQAARVFTELGFKPTPVALDRMVAQGKSLLQLLREGANGRETAKKLVRIVQRGTDSRSKLDAMLGDRRARPDVSDLGTPSFDETA